MYSSSEQLIILLIDLLVIRLRAVIRPPQVLVQIDDGLRVDDVDEGQLLKNYYRHSGGPLVE